MNCKIENCSKQRAFNCEECKTSSSVFSYCMTHAKQHIEINPSHSLTRVCIKVDELTSMILLKSFQNLVAKAQSARAFILKNVNAFMKKTLEHTNFVLTELLNSEKQYNDAIRLMEIGSYIDCESIIESELLITKFIKDEKEFQNEVKKIEKTKEFIDKIMLKEGNIKEIKEKLKKLKASIDGYSILKETIFNKFDMKELIRKQNAPYIHYFENDPSKYTCTNVLDSTSQLISINGINKNNITNSCSCYIDNETLFLGVDDSASLLSKNNYFIIDLKLNKAKPLNPGHWAKGKGCCYYNSTIYTLGGLDSNNKCLNNFESYKIGNYNPQFSKLTPLPQASSYISCEVLQNKLYYAGYNSWYLLIYEIENRVFRSGFSLLENSFKSLLYANGIFFIIESGKIYKYGAIGKFYYELVNQGTLQNQSFLIAPPIFYRDCFYFIQNDKALYAFNIKSYRLNLLEKIY